MTWLFNASFLENILSENLHQCLFWMAWRSNKSTERVPCNRFLWNCTEDQKVEGKYLLTYLHSYKLTSNTPAWSVVNVGSKFCPSVYVASGHNISVPSLERVPRVPRHPLKLSNGCQAPVLRRAFSFKDCLLLKIHEKRSKILAFQWSWHPSC